jgi:hypothetical protein
MTYLIQYYTMRKYRVYYWRETGDDCIDCEIDLMASSFDNAYKVFREAYRSVKIREITEL